MGLTYSERQPHLVDPITGRQILPAVSREKLLPFFLPIYDDERREHRMESFLEELDARTVLGLEQILSTCDPLAHYYLVNEIKSAFKVLRNTESQSSLNNLAVFAQTVYGDSDTIAAGSTDVYLNGFYSYPEFRNIHDWLTGASVEEVAAAHTLIRLTMSCRYSRLVHDDREDGPVPADEASVVFTDDYLRHKVLENPLLVDDIAAIVRANSMIDPETLRLMLDFDQKALREGAL